MPVTKAEISAIKAVLDGYGIVDNWCLAANCAAAAADAREGKKRGTRQWPTPESFA